MSQNSANIFEFLNATNLPVPAEKARKFLKYLDVTLDIAALEPAGYLGDDEDAPSINLSWRNNDHFFVIGFSEIGDFWLYHDLKNDTHVSEETPTLNLEEGTEKLTALIKDVGTKTFRFRFRQEK